MATIAEEINEAVAHLAPSDQQRVLNYARGLIHVDTFAPYGTTTRHPA